MLRKSKETVAIILFEDVKCGYEQFTLILTHIWHKTSW